MAFLNLPPINLPINLPSLQTKPQSFVFFVLKKNTFSSLSADPEDSEPSRPHFVCSASVCLTAVLI